MAVGVLLRIGGPCSRGPASFLTSVACGMHCRRNTQACLRWSCCSFRGAPAGPGPLGGAPGATCRLSPLPSLNEAPLAQLNAPLRRKSCDQRARTRRLPERAERVSGRDSEEASGSADDASRCLPAHLRHPHIVTRAFLKLHRPVMGAGASIDDDPEVKAAKARVEALEAQVAALTKAVAQLGGVSGSASAARAAKLSLSTRSYRACG